MKKSVIVYFLLFVSLLSLQSCGDFLDRKPNLSLEVPRSLDELEALLSSENQINMGANIDIVASDDFFHTEQALQGETNELYVNAYFRNFFVGMYGDRLMPDWTVLYEKIYVANFCLEQLDNIVRNLDNAPQFDRIKGNSLFLRAYSYSELLKIFTPQYDVDEFDNLSIPLVLDTDINTLKDFAPLALVYDLVFKDLEDAEFLLPAMPEIRTRGSRSAVYSLKARVYLTMKEYGKALEAVDKSLSIDQELIDFNTLNSQLSLPIIAIGNPEIIYYQFSGTYRLLNYNPESRINSELYDSFDVDDLRRTVYFYINAAGNVNYKGHFTGRSNFFTGLSVSENLLIKAECSVRLGDLEDGFEALNMLLISRYSHGRFESLNVLDYADPLGKILLERRKELIFRGRRWSDLKRLLGERSEYFPLIRVVEDTVIEMGQSPEAFVFPIPLEEFLNR